MIYLLYRWPHVWFVTERMLTWHDKAISRS
jgi:hypothetical protein